MMSFFDWLITQKKKKKGYQTFNDPKISLKIVKHFFGENMMSSYLKSS
jgi:hypothetical protein